MNWLREFWRDAWDQGSAVGVVYLLALGVAGGVLVWGCAALGTYTGEMIFK